MKDHVTLIIHLLQPSASHGTFFEALKNIISKKYTLSAILVSEKKYQPENENLLPNIFTKIEFIHLEKITTAIEVALTRCPKESSALILDTSHSLSTGFLEGLIDATRHLHNVGFVTPLTQTHRLPLNSADECSLFQKAANELNLLPPQIHYPTSTPGPLWIAPIAMQCLDLSDINDNIKVNFLSKLICAGERIGLRHLISPSSVSFIDPSIDDKHSETTPEKDNTELKMLADKIKEYNYSSHLALENILLTLKAYQLKSPAQDGIIHLLHADVTSSRSGGTEKHVNWLSEQTQEIIHIIISPTGDREGYYRAGIRKGTSFFSEILSHNQAQLLVSKCLDIFETCHLHHTLHLSEEITSQVINRARRLVLTVHDYFYACPTINLLTGVNKDIFCEAETNSSKCNACLKTYYGLENIDISIYRANSRQIFTKAEKIIFPSHAAFQYTARVFPEIATKSEVLNHDLSHYLPYIAKKDGPTQGKPLFVFLGAIRKHKGAPFVLETANALVKNYQVEIWGAIDDPSGKLSKDVIVRPYSSLVQLNNLCKAHEPIGIFLPSIWAETFCYAYYEAVLMTNAIPIVSKYGNPANEVIKHKCGIVLPSLTRADGVAAADEVTKNYEAYFVRMKIYKEVLTQRDSYTSKYLSILNPSAVTDLQVSEVERFAIQTASTSSHHLVPKRGKIQTLKEFVRRSNLAYRLTVPIYKVARLLYRRARTLNSKKSYVG